MSIEKGLIMTLRVMEKLVEIEENSTMDQQNYGEVLDVMGISNKSKKAMIDIMKAVVLMTSGSVQTIRNPESFDESKSSKWRDLVKKTAVRKVLLSIGFSLGSVIKKEDYKLANALLREMGSSTLSIDEIKGFMKNLEIVPAIEKAGLKDKDFLIPTELYRGLHTISDDALLFLIENKGVWDIGESVSTSAMFEIAHNFTEENIWDTRVLLKISNPKRQGFVAKSLSKFDEDEIILSGKLKFGDWTINCKIVTSSGEYIPCSIKTGKVISKSLEREIKGMTADLPIDKTEFVKKLLDNETVDLTFSNQKDSIEYKIIAIKLIYCEMNCEVI